MSDRGQKYETFLDDLGPIVDGDPAALERHADFLADDDEARDLRHEALGAAHKIAWAGADYVPPADLEARLLAVLDGQVEPGRSTSPGFAAPNAMESGAGLVTAELPPLAARSAPTTPGYSTSAGARPPSSELDSIPATPVPPAPVPRTPVAQTPIAQTPIAQTMAQAALQPLPPVSAQHLGTRPGFSASSPTHIAPAPRELKARGGKRGLLLILPIAGGVVALAAAAVLAVVLTSGTGDEEGTEHPPEPTLATRGIDGRLEHVDRAASDARSGVEVRRMGSESFVALAAGDAVPAGAVVRTDERTRAAVSLADGSRLVLNHATELELVADAPRSYRIRQGEIVAEVAHLEGAPHAFFHTATGRVEVLGTKFELSATGDVTSVRVSRGAVAIAGSDGASSEVREGEEGIVRAGRAPEVAPVTDLARQLAWSELGGRADAQSAEGDVLPGIGSLRARRPGEQQDRERPLSVAQHTVRVRIVGNVARTEVESVFRNDDEHTLEGIYRFPLPPDAQIARLALDVEGRMEEGSFVERDRAAQIWRGVIRNATAVRERRNDEEFIWVPGPWRDPAILEWQRGGQFELRIFPIPARGERRVILAYTQTVPPQGARRRYVYPLAHSADGSTRVGRFELDVRVAGAQRVAASGYRVTSAAEADATRLSLTENGFQPKGDLVVEYELPGASSELAFWTYRGEATSAPPTNSREEDREVLGIQQQLSEDVRPYVAFALRPRLPRATARRERDYVVIVDSSQSMVGERFERASRLAARVISEMDRRDRVTVLACDYACRALPGGLTPPSAQVARDAAQWLGTIEPAGASDLVSVLREAAAGVTGERRDGREVHLLYVGDGTATVGYRRASSLSAEVRALAEAEHVVVSTVGVGGDADTLALAAIARASGGHYVPYVPGQQTAVAALGVLETTYGVSLESPRVELPAGLTDSAPSELPTIRAGQEVVLVARMDRDRVDGDVVLRGTVAGRPFEQRYRVEMTPSDAAGNRFVPRLWAASQIEELQLRGRGDERARIVALSKAFGVMSRHTSLLVLESEAMFRAFRVDRHDGAPAWTGEEDVLTGSADGRMTVEGETGIGGLGAVGHGSGAGGSGTGFGRSSRSAERGGGDDMEMSEEQASARDQRGPMRAERPRGGAPSNPFGGGGGGGEVVDGWSRGGEGASPREPQAETRREANWRWNDMPAPATGTTAATQQPPMAAPVTPRPMTTPRPRAPGQWMRRVWVRAGEIQPATEPGSAERDAARTAERALSESPDSRDRHRDAVRQLSRAGELTRALEVAEAWVARDRLDAEALTAKADILGRLGRRDESLRVLTGTVDLSPNNDALHTRLARAFDRAGRPERACAHRIALAEVDESDPDALAAAMRCERELGRAGAADRLMAGVREPSVRTRAERALSQQNQERRFGGDFTIDGEWDAGADLDISIVTPQGTRLSWMGGRTTVEGENAWSPGRERLGLRWTGAGTYFVEVSRTDPGDTREVRGELRLRVLGQQRTVPFTMRGGRATVARVRVTRESRLEQVTGTVGRGW